MRKKKMLRQAMTAFLMLLTFCFSPFFAQAQNWLSAKGNKLYDSQGKEVRLTGINWFGFETSQLKFHGIWSRDMKSVLKQIKDMGFNCIRIPYTDAMLKPDAAIQIDSYGSDPYTGVSPMNGDIVHIKKPVELLDEVVKWCQANHMKIILDNHARVPDGYMNESIWYSDIVPEAKWIENWVFLANRYKSYDAVIGMDLDNEPHGKTPGSPNTSTWGNSSPATDWNKGAERCGNAILAVNPNVLILVEGIELHNGNNYWWGGNLIGAKDYPIVLSKPNKLVYSPHEYGPRVWPQPWFEDPSFPTNMPGIWDKHFGFLYNNNTAPLLVGEFGILSAGGKDEIWIKNFLQYMGLKYSWTFWCFNPNSGDTGGIVGDDWVTPVAWKLNLLKPYMAPPIPNGTIGGGNQPPVARFTPSVTSGKAPLAVNFDASASSDANGDVLTYAWTFGDGTSGTGKTVAHAYPTAGSYTATLTVNDGKGGSGSATAIITVTTTSTGNTDPVARFTTNGTSGRAPLAISFDASASTDADGDVLSYAWNFGDGTSGTGKTIAHTYTTAGSYTATLTVSDGKGGAGSTTAAITVTNTAAVSLKVQYKTVDTNAGDAQIKPHFQLVNTGGQAIAFSDVKIRYWFTKEGTASQSFFIDWAVMGAAKINGTFVNLPSPRTGANNYLEVGFTTTAGTLPAGGSTGEIQTRIGKSDWSAYNEVGDYSYDPTKTAYTDWSRMTVYYQGQLVWGTEPAATAARVGTIENDLAKGFSVEVFANPVLESVAKVNVYSERKNTYAIQLVDIKGKVYTQQQVALEAGEKKIVDLRLPASFANGLFLVKVSNSQRQTIHKKLVVLK